MAVHFQRELGIFGSKISIARQKGTAVPEALAVDVMVAAILLSRNRRTASESEQTEELSETEPTSSTQMGCILHNFPRSTLVRLLKSRFCGVNVPLLMFRSTEEAKLLEKALIASADNIDEEEKLSRITALETMSARSDPVGLPFHSGLSAAICLSIAEEPPADDVDPNENITPDAIGEHDNKKRASVLAHADSKKAAAFAAAEAHAKAEMAEESNRLKERQAQLEGFWSQSTCLTMVRGEFPSRIV